MSFVNCLVLAQGISPASKISVSTEPLNFEVTEFSVPEFCRNIFCDRECKNIGFECFAKNPEENRKTHLVVTVRRASDNKQLYSKNFKYAKNFILTANSIAEYDKTSTAIFSLEYGAELLNKKYSVLGLINDNIILTSVNGLTSVKVRAYSMTTGKERWRTSLIGEAGLTYNQTIDEESDYIVTNDLVRINWETGKTQKLKAKTSITDKKAVFNMFLAAAVLGAIGGIAGGITGYYAYPIFIPSNQSYRSTMFSNRHLFYWPQYGNISKLTSNIASNDNLNYFADRNSIRCFDDNFNERWNTELKDKGTCSNLFLKGDTLVMINLASALDADAGLIQREKPYIATFNSKDGGQLTMQKIDVEDKSVCSSTLIDNRLHLLMDNKEAIYDFASNKMNIVPIDTTMTGPCIRYINEYTYFSKNDDNTFYDIRSTSDTTLAVTSNGSIIDIRSPKVSVVHAPHSYYQTVAFYDDMLFLTKENPGGDTYELWCIKDDKATLVSSNVIGIRKQPQHLIVWLDNNKVQLLNLK